jgi:hypothetical protein
MLFLALSNVEVMNIDVVYFHFSIKKYFFENEFLNSTQKFSLHQCSL